MISGLFLAWVFFLLEIIIVLVFYLLNENLFLDASSWAFVTRACALSGMIDERTRSSATCRAPIFMWPIVRESGWSTNLNREGFDLDLKMSVDELVSCHGLL